MDLSNLLANDTTFWIFNPPPYFSGKWEAAVKSIQFYLQRVIDEVFLTHKKMACTRSKSSGDRTFRNTFRSERNIHHLSNFHRKTN